MDFSFKGSKLIYIDSNAVNAFSLFSEAMYRTMRNTRPSNNRDVVIVCIGTDRSTGDSLGPIVGHKLKSLRYENVHVFGNLDSPVHAKNLQEVTDSIFLKYRNPFIIAIDACLGKAEHVGHITVGQGPLKPGSAVNKELKPIGDMHITGIVNFSGFMDFLILQNTRLGTVMKIADVISGGIKYVLWKASREEMLGRNTPTSLEPRNMFFDEINP